MPTEQVGTAIRELAFPSEHESRVEETQEKMPPFSTREVVLPTEQASHTESAGETTSQQQMPPPPPTKELALPALPRSTDMNGFEVKELLRA